MSDSKNQNPFELMVDALVNKMVDRMREVIREEIRKAQEGDLSGKDWLRAEEAAKVYGLPGRGSRREAEPERSSAPEPESMCSSPCGRLRLTWSRGRVDSPK